MSLIFWHNPRCSKSREALALLREKAVTLQVVNYLETPPDAAMLRDVISKLGFRSARQLMRNKEAIFNAKGLADTSLSEEQLIAAMVAEPTLIERPLLINGDRARLGRPPEQLLEIL